MKRSCSAFRYIAGIILFIILLTGLTACGQETSGETGGAGETTATVIDDQGPKVVTTIFASYDFARQLTDDRASVSLLLKPGAESHSYEPTPQDIILIGESDLFIYVGGENDAWVDEILESMDTSKMKIVRLLDCVQAVEEELVEGMEAEEEEEEGEEEESEWDEHVWTDPKNAILICEEIKKQLVQIDPGHEAQYQEKLTAYEKELKLLDQDFAGIVANAKRQELIFGDRFPLRYFTEAYGLTYYAAFPGCSSETEPSAATVSFLTDQVKKDQVPIVFQIELSNGAIAKSIAEATGAKVETFYTCHNVSLEDFEAGVTYVDLMRRNIEPLKEALNGWLSEVVK